jgi:hypothetical protein
MRLTKDEIKLVAFLLGALLSGLAIKHYRHRDRLHFPPPAILAVPPPATEGSELE